MLGLVMSDYTLIPDPRRTFSFVMLSSAGNAMEMTKMAMYLSGTCREIELGCQSSDNPWM